MCHCGAVDVLSREEGSARCLHCGRIHPVSPRGVIDFAQKKTEQSSYFDGIYAAGHLHKIDELYETSIRTYENSIETSEAYLKLCGYDFTHPLEGLSILDVACGSGWVTAGLLQHKLIRNCNFHAFDISSHGPESLARFAETVQSTNRLEMSVQDAEAMAFGEAYFDIIIGSSVLHHFNEVEPFLRKCKRILKPGGVATFGEPFAVGYGLGAAVIMLAQKQLGTTYQAVEDLYNDIAYRIKSPRELLTNLVDKHLFFQSSFLTLAQRTGFKDVQFVPLAPRDFYRDHFIDELLSERAISDTALAGLAKEMYKTMFALFDTESFGHSAAAFIQLVMHT